MGVGWVEKGRGTRPAGPRPTYRLIQVLRGLAALMVVAHHGTIMLWERDRLFVQTWIAGGSGVDIFFVISGFVMVISTASRPPTLHAAKTFLVRRVERIAPMYWIVTTAKVALLLAAPALALNGLGGWHHVVGSYLFLPSLSAEHRFEPVVVVGWTLNFEMAFYVLFAGALALRWRPLIALALPLALVPLLYFVPVRWLMMLLPMPLWFYISTVLWEFLFGMVLGAAVGWVRGLPWGWGLVLVCGGLLLLLGHAAPLFTYWRGFYWGLPALAMVAGAVSMEQRWGARSPRWALEMGDASYSIYLVHTLTLPAIGMLLVRWRHGWPGEIGIALAFTVLLSALAGEVVYLTVERPIMKWFNGRRRTAIPANG